MKKQIILPVSLLLSFAVVQAADVAAPEVVEVVEVTEAAVAVQPEVVPAVAPVVAHPAEEVMPAPVAPAELPAAPEVAPVVNNNGIPTEDDIKNILGLLAAYQHQSTVLKNLHDLAVNDVELPALPNEDSIRSLLNLLELHKKEADLIVALRSSITSLQQMLGQWDANVSALLKKKQHEKSAKQKVAKRGLDFDTVKEINKPRGNGK